MKVSDQHLLAGSHDHGALRKHQAGDMLDWRLNRACVKCGLRRLPKGLDRASLQQDKTYELLFSPSSCSNGILTMRPLTAKSFHAAKYRTKE